MEISDDVFARARRLDRRAVDALYAQVYPPVQRIARALAGREDVADGVVRFVMLRAARVAPRWRDATAAERWFLHHTVLTARRAARHEPDVRRDLLATVVGAAGDPDPAWLAFVRAVRRLPRQQLEAIILHYGEHLNVRYLGVAMDCSADAAQAHLEAGQAALRELGAAAFDTAANRLAAAYARLGPATADAPADALQWAARALRPRRIRCAIAWLAVAAAAAGAALWLALR